VNFLREDVQVWVESPVLQLEPLQGKEQNSEAREVLGKVDAAGLNAALTIVYPNPEHPI
jgi:hypothetical protein